MSDPVKKRVDESWKEQVEQEKESPPAAAPSARPDDLGTGRVSSPSAPAAARPEAAAAAHAGEPEMPQARFDLFLSSLVMDVVIALGETPHPVTRKHATNLAQARYLIDLLGILEEKTKGNLTVDEARLLKDALYQLRMRYLAKSGG
ncbi:MAG: DUF1844 domain-containing protein [Candidatus Omnitrophica bacterium]|nr:DUF1844 domain-containing protein [Candidatus Omnitrophota bacterium]